MRATGLIFAFGVFFLASLASAEFRASVDGIESSYASANFPWTTYPSLTLCGELKVLAINESCQLYFSGNFTQEDVLYLPWLQALQNGCVSYDQLFLQLLQKIEAFEQAYNVALPRNTLVVLGSVVDGVVGTAYEPYGETVNYTTFPFYLISITQNPSTLIRLDLIQPHICADLEIGDWPIYFSSGRYIGEKAIFVGWYALIILVCVMQIVISLKGSYWHKFSVFFCMIVYAIFRLMPVAIDYRGKYGKLSGLAEGFLYWFGYIFLFYGYCCLLYSWIVVVRGDVFNAVSRRIARALSILILISFLMFTICCFLSFLAAQVAGISFILIAVPFALLLPPVLSVMITFLVLGARMLLLLKRSIQLKKSLVLIRITILMILAILTFLGYIVCMLIRSAALFTGAEVSFSTNYSLVISFDILGVIGCSAVSVSYCLHTFDGVFQKRFFTLSSSYNGSGTGTGTGTGIGSETSRKASKEINLSSDGKVSQEREKKEKGKIEMGALQNNGVDAIILDLQDPDHA